MRLDESKIPYDRVIETVVLLLMATGTVFVFSAGATVGGSYDLSQFYNFTTLKQVVFFPAAVLVMYGVSRINYRRYSISHQPPGYSLAPYLYVISVILLVVVLIWGVERNYSKRWLDLVPGPVYVSFQPSELAKWVIIIALAAYLERHQNTLDRFWGRFVPACALAGVFVALIIRHDFGTAAFIVMMMFVMLLLGGAKLLHLASPMPIVIPGLIAAVMISPTRINRILNFIDPGKMPYQAKQSLVAISTGGLWGKGLGRGVIKYGHLPEDTTDFIFSIIAEEMGISACVFVVGLFVIFAIAGIRAVMRCPDRFGRILGAGIVVAITIQAAINIGVVTVVLPTKGIPLPFISAGGTSMLLTAAAVGVVLNIARRKDQQDVLLMNFNLESGSDR